MGVNSVSGGSDLPEQSTTLQKQPEVKPDKESIFTKEAPQVADATLDAFINGNITRMEYLELRISQGFG
jgi:hypothetical protein